MQKFSIKTSNGIVSNITNLPDGNIGIEVLDTDSQITLTKVASPFDLELEKGSAVDINYNIVGQEINGKVSGSFDFDIAAKKLESESVKFGK